MTVQTNLVYYLFLLVQVNSVRLPHHIADKRRFSGTALVEFSSVQDTEHVLSQSLVYAGADLVLIPK